MPGLMKVLGILDILQYDGQSPVRSAPDKMSVAPEEKQCRRALAGEGVKSSSRLDGHKHEMIRSRNMLRLKEKDGIVREGQAGKACALVS